LPNNRDFIHAFFDEIKEHSVSIWIHQVFYDFLLQEMNIDFGKNTHQFHDSNDLPEDLDMIFSIGGDGTFLETVSIVRNKDIPIAGINSGRLGFLANISKTKVKSALQSIFRGDYSLEERSLLELDTKGLLFKDYNYALNEITVHKKDSASMIAITAYVDGKLLNTYWADGLIVSTPTGSTAYSLSVGGPIVVPQSKNIIIAPIAPHNLTVRPIVLSDDVEICLKVEKNYRDTMYLVAMDYRSELFDSPMKLTIRKADFTIKMVQLPDTQFFKTMRNKMMWGKDKRN
jgi:NAD+ kinase